MKIISKEINFLKKKSLKVQLKFLFWYWKKDLKKTKKNLKCGLHSGFRLCDVLFFTFVWIYMFPTILGDFYRKSFRKKLGYSAGYVECPICCFIVKPKFITVKSCSCPKKCCYKKKI